jgi:hypothetical protein
MRPNAAPRRRLPPQLGLGLFVLAAGALEGWFGRPELFGDDIAYLDVANMIHLGNWRAAFNPLWSIGYPLLLSAIKVVFPATIRGELHAVFFLNLSIYLAGWLAFLYFLRRARLFLAFRKTVLHSWPPDRDGPDPGPHSLMAAACIFVTIQTAFGRVSSVGPDQLVVCLFFVASALLLRFAMQPSARNGVMLGATLGIGFIAKAIFLPLSVIFIACALLPLRRRLERRVALSIPGAVLCFVLPYAAGLSWAIGRPTLGESAALNYAFHVNQLPHWMGWQGGPPRLGYPAHPVQLLRTHPAVLAFAEPFAVTYPPQYNIHYWYDGYRHFFSPVNALRAILANLHALEAVLHENWAFALAILLCAGLWISYPRGPAAAKMASFSRVRNHWQLYVPSLLAFAVYLQVHLESRYIAAPIAVLAMLPLLSRSRPWVLVVLVAGTAANLSVNLHPTLLRAVHRTDMQSGGQWEIARSLSTSGLRSADRVAVVSTGNDIRCTWAYGARVHIVAAIGNDAYDPQDQEQDMRLFWTDLATQQDVLRLFRQQGAVAVIVLDAPATPISRDWQAVPGSGAWLLRLK